MTEAQTLSYCLNCNRSEEEMPLVSLRYANRQTWICSQCLPVLIHHPQRLVGKLDGADKIPPVPHNH